MLHIPVIVELGREASFCCLSLFYLQGVSRALKSLGKDFREKGLVHELASCIVLYSSKKKKKVCS